MTHFHIYDTNEYTQEIEVVSDDYEQSMLISFYDFCDEEGVADPDQEEDFREYAEEAVKATFGCDAILVWE